jgi:antitoxin ParD1/3/4
MNISLPDELKDFVEAQVAAGRYGSPSEFVRELIRKEQDRQHLRGLLLAGAASGRAGRADDAYFDALRAKIRQGAGPG